MSGAVRLLCAHHSRIRDGIERRLRSFRRAGRLGLRGLFAEFAFCLLTPQSSARVCWRAVNDLRRMNLLFSAPPARLAAALRTVRFRHTKARRIVENRTRWTVVLRRIRTTPDDAQLRDWLAENVRGMGMKEASHFLRNIGRGSSLAILDRHILRRLTELGVIAAVPRTLTPARYREIEALMRSFASNNGLPMDHLDLLLWHKSTGDLFK